MAINSRILCMICHMEKIVVHSAGDYPNICHECETARQQTAEDKHISTLQALTLEQRIERIERQLYQQANTPSWNGRIG